MIFIRGRWVRFAEVWFTGEPPANPDADIVRFRLSPAPIAGASCEPFHTLVNDLRQDEAEIMSAFGHTNRYKVKRAEARDGLRFEAISDCAPHLEPFADFYDAFARQKGLQVSYRRGLKAASDAGELVLTRASRDDLILVWHAYIRSGETAALLHSASHFREVSAEQRALIARANRWLHWRDMLDFRARGVRRYDWGGVFEDESAPERASINRFKREFGGADLKAFNCSRPQTLRGRAYSAWASIMGRFEPD